MYRTKMFNIETIINRIEKTQLITIFALKSNFFKLKQTNNKKKVVKPFKNQSNIPCGPIYIIIIKP